VNFTSPLREITYHMGPCSVTCHPAEVTFPPLPQPKLVLDLATPKGCKAELVYSMAHWDATKITLRVYIKIQLTQPDDVNVDVLISVRDPRQKKLVQFFFRFLPR